MATQVPKLRLRRGGAVVFSAPSAHASDAGAADCESGSRVEPRSRLALPKRSDVSCVGWVAFG